MTIKTLLNQARKLNERDRLRLADEIWRSVENGWSAGMPEWHKEELDRRLQAHRENPTAVVSWEAIEKKMAKLSRRGRR